MVAHGVPAHTLIVEPLTHTARWVTSEVEPVIPVLDQTQRWHDVTQRLIGHHATACPLGVAGVEVAHSCLYLAGIVRVILDVHRDDLAIGFQ